MGYNDERHNQSINQRQQWRRGGGMYWQPDENGGHYVRRGAPEPDEPVDLEQKWQDEDTKADEKIDAARDKE